MKESCKECKFSKTTSKNMFSWQGKCRRYPPVIVLSHFDKHSYNIEFPEVNDVTWCGEFKQKD